MIIKIAICINVTAVHQQSHTPIAEMSQPNTPAAVMTPKTAGTSTDDSPSTVFKRWPDVYMLPLLPRHVQDALRSASCLVDADSSALHRLVHCVYEDMMQHSL